jgi:hypothetical protein
MSLASNASNGTTCVKGKGVAGFQTLASILAGALLVAGCGAASGQGGPDGGGDGTGGGTGTGTGGGSSNLTRITLPVDGNQIVTAIYCSAPDACVVSTDGFDPGRIFTTDGRTITATLFTGDDSFGDKIGGANVGWSGFSKVGDRLVGRITTAGYLHSAPINDIAKAASWTVEAIGSRPEGWAGNTQLGIASVNGKSLLFSKRFISEGQGAPGANAQWNDVYAPQALPPVPADIDAQRKADGTICNSEPTVPLNATQGVYVAPDLSLVAFPSGQNNQTGDDTPGICLSTDNAHTFHHVEFAGLTGGTAGVGCTSKDHCVAYADILEDPPAGQAYVFVSNDASKGKASTWTAAKMPALSDGTLFRYVFFAPDAMHGWLLGWKDGASPLIFATADGGASWTAATSILGAGVTNFRPYSGVAVDASHIYIGGESVSGKNDSLFAIKL